MVFKTNYHKSQGKMEDESLREQEWPVTPEYRPSKSNKKEQGTLSQTRMSTKRGK